MKWQIKNSIETVKLKQNISVDEVLNGMAMNHSSSSIYRQIKGASMYGCTHASTKKSSSQRKLNRTKNFISCLSFHVFFRSVVIAEVSGDLIVDELQKNLPNKLSTSY